MIGPRARDWRAAAPGARAGMRELQLEDGRTCVLHGTGVHGTTTDPHSIAPRPELVEYVLRGAAGQCALPGDWASHGVDELRVLVESAAHHALTGALHPFDGPNGDAIRDLVVAAARMPIVRLRTLATAAARHQAERRTISALVHASEDCRHAAGRLPGYLLAAATVVLADGPDADRAVPPPSPSEVAQAVGSAAMALLVGRRPGPHDHSALARAYRALVAPFHE